MTKHDLIGKTLSMVQIEFGCNFDKNLLQKPQKGRYNVQIIKSTRPKEKKKKSEESEVKLQNFIQ